jgi:hypothetical protein
MLNQEQFGQVLFVSILGGVIAPCALMTAKALMILGGI